jgi:SbcC/RAD50-like, Walker B motif/P-loop containing region of AAA domain
MSAQPICLTRIIAVNWYGFRQIFDVSNHTLIAGAFGSGKSALLDLIQYVMLGEDWRPNRAAAGVARGRTLVSYCLCDTNYTRDGEPHYVRRSGVTLIGLEFTWPTEGNKTPRRETWGVRIQYTSPTSKAEQTYFCVPARLDWAEIAPTGDLMSEEDFKSYVRREYEMASSRKCLFPRQKDYLAEMATPHHLWFDEKQFAKTFPKAIAFEAEKDVEKFIRQFILEENPLEVRDVKTAVGAYRETQARLERQQEEAQLLRKVGEQHTAYEQAKREAAILKHLGFALEQARLSELVGRHEKDIADLKTKHTADNEAFDKWVGEAGQLTTALGEFRLDSDEAELQGKLAEQKSKRAEQTGLLQAQQSVRQRLRDLRHRWTHWLKRGAVIKLDGLGEILTVEDRLIDALSAPDEATGLQAMPDLAERFHQLFQGIGKLIEPLTAEITAISNRLKQIAADLDRIDERQTPGSFPLFQAIKARLANSPTPPEQLCRLIEVKPAAEEWRTALELVLGRNRFAIVLGSGEDYRAALEVFRKRPPAERGVDESLVHPREAAELSANVRKDSLAEKVEFAKASEAIRRVVENFARHLLGHVIAAERVEDLDSCERGITRDGIYKQVPTRRRLRQLPGFEFTLGTEGLKRLHAALTREQKGLMAERENKQALIASINAWLDSGKQGGLGDPRLPDRSGELSRLPLLEQELSALKLRIEFLSTKERTDRLRKLNKLQENLAKANQEIGRLKDTRGQFTQKQKELQDALDEAARKLDAAKLATTDNRVRLRQGILDAEIQEQLEKLIAEFKTWSERKDAAVDRAGQTTLKAANTRNARNNERRALINAVDTEGRPKHPQYRHDFDPDEESNEQWQTRLDALEKVQIEESKKLAAERRKDWERRLKDQVLNRLNENLQASERAVRQLRTYLDVQVGKHKYRISQERDSAFATLWSLLDSGFEPTDELLAAGRNQEVQNALDELMTAVEANGQADARALSLLDYRNYHRYDIKMRPADHASGPEISFGRSGVSMSGGENQAPFFISMLAAARRVYDLGGGRSQHLGLVVMDEAFSKLSGDGVEDCLELARNFNLQLLMAFPIDRLGVMTPYADTVVELRKEEVRDAAGFIVQLDNIPIVLPPDQVQESIS